MADFSLINAGRQQDVYGGDRKVKRFREEGIFILTGNCDSYKSGINTKEWCPDIKSALFGQEVVVMKKPPQDHPEIESPHSARELRQELRAMGYRLTGNEAYEDLLRLLKEELNRQWFKSASRGNVIRRRKSPANTH